MRSTGSQQDAGHRARVADSRQATTAASTNFEYDDNEWDIGIGDLIIDLDADIEKTNEGSNPNNTAIQNATSGSATTVCPVGGGGGSTSGGPVSATTAANVTGHLMATNASPNTSAKAAAKMAIEHSAIVDKGLKMKIKRTKPGTKTSEAKHEIVKSNEQNGNVEGTDVVSSSNKGTSGGGSAGGGSGGGAGKHPQTAVSSGVASTGVVPATSASQNVTSNSSGSGNSKRSSGGHRRDKTRDKHSDKPGPKVNAASVPVAVSEVNGMVRVSAPQPGPQRSVFPASTGPGPPSQQQTGPSPGPPPSPAAATAQGSAAKPEQAKIGSSGSARQPTPPSSDDRSSSPPPSKKLKTDPKVSYMFIYRNK